MPEEEKPDDESTLKTFFNACQNVFRTGFLYLYLRYRLILLAWRKNQLRNRRDQLFEKLGTRAIQLDIDEIQSPLRDERDVIISREKEHRNKIEELEEQIQNLQDKREALEENIDRETENPRQKRKQVEEKLELNRLTLERAEEQKESLSHRLRRARQQKEAENEIDLDRDETKTNPSSEDIPTEDPDEIERELKRKKEEITDLQSKRQALQRKRDRLEEKIDRSHTEIEDKRSQINEEIRRIESEIQRHEQNIDRIEEEKKELARRLGKSLYGKDLEKPPFQRLLRRIDQARRKRSRLDRKTADLRDRLRNETDTLPLIIFFLICLLLTVIPLLILIL